MSKFSRNKRARDESRRQHHAKKLEKRHAKRDQANAPLADASSALGTAQSMPTEGAESAAPAQDPSGSSVSTHSPIENPSS